MKRKDIKLCLWLTAGEVLTFVFVAAAGVQPTEGTSNVVREIARLLLPNLGNMMMTVATTWYVVFTYYILVATDQARRQSAEPYVSIIWSKEDKLHTECAQEFMSLSAGIRERLKSLGVRPAADPFPDRYVNVEIANERSAKIGMVDLVIEAKVVENKSKAQVDLGLAPVTMTWRRERRNVPDAERFSITVIDLGDVPDVFEVLLSVKYIQYTAADSEQRIGDFNGDRAFTVKGALRTSEAEVRPQGPESEPPARRAVGA